MDEKLLYTIFTIVYSTVRAREGNLIIISISGDIEDFGTSADGIERGIEDFVVRHTDNLALHGAEYG